MTVTETWMRGSWVLGPLYMLGGVVHLYSSPVMKPVLLQSNWCWFKSFAVWPFIGHPFLSAIFMDTGCLIAKVTASVVLSEEEVDLLLTFFIWEWCFLHCIPSRNIWCFAWPHTGNQKHDWGGFPFQTVCRSLFLSFGWVKEITKNAIFFWLRKVISLFYTGFWQMQAVCLPG